MPLLTTTTKTNARIAELGSNIAAHLAAAATAANAIVANVLALDDVQLADWLNAQGDELETLLGAHSQLGEAINNASGIASGILDASGLTTPATTVDLRSVTEKLAAQHRAIELTDSGWIVKPLPKPEPEPEPEQPTTDQ